MIICIVAAVCRGLYGYFRRTQGCSRVYLRLRQTCRVGVCQKDDHLSPCISSESVAESQATIQLIGLTETETTPKVPTIYVIIQIQGRDTRCSQTLRVHATAISKVYGIVHGF